MSIHVTEGLFIATKNQFCTNEFQLNTVNTKGLTKRQADGSDDGSRRLAHRPARRRRTHDSSLPPMFRRRQNVFFVQKHTLIVVIHKRKLSSQHISIMKCSLCGLIVPLRHISKKIHLSKANFIVHLLCYICYVSRTVLLSEPCRGSVSIFICLFQSLCHYQNNIMVSDM